VPEDNRFILGHSFVAIPITFKARPNTVKRDDEIYGLKKGEILVLLSNDGTVSHVRGREL